VNGHCDDGARSDADLVASARDGDKAAFGDLAVRHRPLALAVCTRFLGDRDLAADVVAEAVVVALVDLHRLADPERFGSWLCGIALNLARQRLRRRHRSPEVPLDALRSLAVGLDDDSDPAAAAERLDLQRRVRRAIATLADGQREAVLLFYLQGLTHREVAAELGISVNAVKARLHQARAALEPRLREPQEPRVPPVPTVPREEPTMTGATAIDVRVREVRRSAGDDPFTRRHVIVLEEQDGDRCMPLWVGPAEATALALDLEQVTLPRPTTYRFAADLLAATGALVREVQVTRLHEGTFYAVVALDAGGQRHDVDARPSDAINLAVVADVPIRVDAALLDEAAALGERLGWRSYDVAGAAIASEVRDVVGPGRAAGDDPDEPPTP
jgi:RNA polymerase sigma factor (sigma-70 family)